jgi:hypothetical protein
MKSFIFFDKKAGFLLISVLIVKYESQPKQSITVISFLSYLRPNFKIMAEG